MKKLMGFVVVLALLFSVVALAVATGDPLWKEHGKAAKDAQALKAQGKYLEASKVHPYAACRAWYLWNHACSLIGKRDANGDWQYDVSNKAKNAEALQYLDQAEEELNTVDGFDAKSCPRAKLQILIDAVKAEINKNL